MHSCEMLASHAVPALPVGLWKLGRFFFLWREESRVLAGTCTSSLRLLAALVLALAAVDRASPMRLCTVLYIIRRWVGGILEILFVRD